MFPVGFGLSKAGGQQKTSSRIVENFILKSEILAF